MKKTALLAVALATCLGYAPAQAAEVVSSNIVGYNKVTLSPGLNMLGSQFVLVGTQADQDMNEMAQVTGQNGYDANYNPTTTIRVWNGGGYVRYGWSGNLLEDSPDLADEMGVTDHSLDNKWLDDRYEVTDETVSIGSGFWLSAGNAGTVMFSGEVPSTNSVVSVNVAPGLNMLSYPWPVAADMQKIQISGQKGYDANYNPTTTIRVWNGGGYVRYGWSGNLLEDSPDLADEMGVTDHSLDNKWLNDKYEVETQPIAIGTGFWISAEKAGTVTFSY